jgi:hypothetical protein
VGQKIPPPPPPPPRMALLALVDEVGHSFVGVLLHRIEPCSHLFNPLRTKALASWFLCATDATHGDIFFPGSAACGRLSECHCCSQLNCPQRQPVGLEGCTCWSFEHESPSPLIEGALTTPPPTSQDHMTRIMLSHTINLQTNQQHLPAHIASRCSRQGVSWQVAIASK